MKILLVGNCVANFIIQDIKILREEGHLVSVVDIEGYDLSPSQIFKYLVKMFDVLPEAMSSDLIWIWFADYHAVPFLLMSKVHGTPVVVCQGDYEVTSDPERNYGNQRLFFRGMLTRWIMRNATRCVMPSPMYKDIAERVEPRASVCTIACGVDIPEEEIPLKENLVITSTVSKDSRIRKGIPLLEEIISGSDIDIRVLVNVPREEYIEMLKRAKVYCQPSSHESFGVSLVEAMSYGCIPVITDRGALPWVVGGCGIIVPYDDIERTKSAIVLALKAGGAADIVAVRKRANHFSIDARKKSIRKLIASLI